MRFPLSQNSFCCLKSKLLCSQSLILCLNVHSNLILRLFLVPINLLTLGHLKALSTHRSKLLPSQSCTDLSSISSCSNFLCPCGWNRCKYCSLLRTEFSGSYLNPMTASLFFFYCLWRIFLWEPRVITTYWKQGTGGLYLTTCFTILFLVYLASFVSKKLQ